MRFHHQTKNNKMQIIKIAFILAVLLLPQGWISAQTIVIPDHAQKGCVKAAEELSLHLGKAIGKKIAIQKESEKTVGPVIYVGQTKYAKACGIDVSAFDTEQWLVQAIDKNNLVIIGGSPRGTLYGAFEFLERKYGVVFASESYTYIPKNQKLEWGADLKYAGKPSFMLRSMDLYHLSVPSKVRAKICGPRNEFTIRNRLNFINDCKLDAVQISWGLDPIYGSPSFVHSYYHYAKDLTDPECFALTEKGERLKATSTAGPGQICWSNPKVRAHFIAKLKQYIKQDRVTAAKMGTKVPWIYDITRNDNRDYCHCPKCTEKIKKYCGVSGIVVEFINEIAAAIADEYPEIRIQMLAYNHTTMPPKGIKVNDNVIVRWAAGGTEWTDAKRDTPRPLTHPHNKYSLGEFLGWKNVAKNISVWDYCALYRNFISDDPDLTDFTQAITQNFPLYYKNNVKAIFANTNASCMVFMQFRYWLIMRYMNCVNLNMDEEIDRFMNAYYGEAKPYMKEILYYLMKRNNEVEFYLSSCPVKSRSDLDDAFFTKTSQLFDKAEAAVKDPVLKEHIKVDRVLFDKVLLVRWHSLKNQGDLQKVIARLRANHPLWMKYYMRAGNPGDLSFTKEIPMLNEIIAKAQLVPPKPALEFKNCATVREFNVIQFRPLWIEKEKDGSFIIDDPDAAGGKALARTDPAGKLSTKLAMGFYDRVAKENRQYISIHIPANKVVQDEKFHFYKIGKITITHDCLIFAHQSWLVQHKMEGALAMGDENDYILYLSIKAQGPAFVKGSKKPSRVLLDRIILIRESDLPNVSKNIIDPKAYRLR